MQQIETKSPANQTSLFESLDTLREKQLHHKIYANPKSAQPNNPLAAMMEVMPSQAPEEEG